MLQHEQTDPPTISPTVPLPVPNAAEARVTPEELNAALKALEDRQSSTVAIGSVVDELHLNATPEQIWEQVQQQRAQQAAEAASKPKMQPVPVMQPKIGKQVRRGWRGIRGWVWIVFWCTGGFGLLAGLPHLLHPAGLPHLLHPQDMTTGQIIAIGGDNETETILVQGKEVVISGDGDKITLRGEAKNVLVSGDGNRLNGTSPKDYQLMGDGNTVKWTRTP